MNELKRPPEKDMEMIDQLKAHLPHLALDGDDISECRYNYLVRRDERIEATINIICAIIGESHLVFGRSFQSCQKMIKDEGLQSIWGGWMPDVPKWALQCLRYNSLRPCVDNVVCMERNGVSFLNDDDC